MKAVVTSSVAMIVEEIGRQDVANDTKEIDRNVVRDIKLSESDTAEHQEAACSN